MAKRKKYKRLNKEKKAEDWCFVCKDGGELRICDYEACPKAYHPQCVGKEGSFLTSEGSWKCGWHSCLVCHRSSSCHCYCCDNAVCSRCIHAAEFFRIKGKYGFCNNCLKLALLVEENADVDSEGENVDLRDRNTYEGLFREYYEIEKEKIGFDKSSILAAKDRLNRDDKYEPTSDSDEGSEEEDDQLVSDYENDGKPHKRGRKKKRCTLQQQKIQRTQSKKQEFVGWGSKALVDFLQFIGQDTTEELSQHDVSSLINKYAQEHDLFNPVKKKKMIICDDRLQAVLGKKMVNQRKIYNLLESHFADNEETSEEEEVGDVAEEKDNILVACKKGKKLDPNKQLTEKRLTPVLSQFAAILPENIKLVYLKKSLVEDMIKQPESIENKIIGSFVRIKSDPYDYSQRNSHHLVQVTGIKQGSSDKGNNEIFLQASNMFRDICLSMLSDDDFTLEECEDLREKVKDGILTKFTVVELEQRARILHEDITKHWIARKLSLLPKLIGHAHEKGWRDKLSDYMKEKKHLEEPSVQSALLQKFPTVTPDVVEFDPLADYKSHDKQEHQCLSETTPSKVVIGEHEDGETCSEKKEQQYHACAPEEKDEFNTLEEPHQFTIIDPNKSKTFLVQEISKCKVVCQSEADTCLLSIGDAKENQLLGNRLGPVEVESKEQERVEVIDLSSDEEAELGFAIEDPDKCIWHVSGHIGNDKYSLSLLERWAKKCPSAQNFKVWKEGQSEEKAIRLSKVINLALPRK